MVRQKTLKTSIGCTGTGLHSGARVDMTLHPAEPGHGIVFRRTDIAGGGSLIAADWRHVVDTRMCTTLGTEAGVRVSTVEHLMAALWGAEIDNALIDISGAEVPVMDGSAAPFVFLIECAGVVEQAAPRRAIEILRRIVVEDEERSVSLTPGAGFSVDFQIDFDNAAVAQQDYFAALAPGAFKVDIARARTFGFEHEVAHLRAAGLARGGSLDNAVVISGDRILNHDGLRYDDEFVRHKILDCVGDLYLAGGPILGHVRGVRSGHRHNNALLRALFARQDAWRHVDLTEDRLISPPAANRLRGPRLAAGD
ncbi:MAG: UDP-3-O-acyl-N-acetylglucosamine deacetylase [Rhodospirillales bacterium]|nr:UDP-3-O-acyl-N-acetylglucosamine deacetylase [Rhodospirillales bacterium]